MALIVEDEPAAAADQRQVGGVVVADPSLRRRVLVGVALAVAVAGAVVVTRVDERQAPPPPTSTSAASSVAPIGVVRPGQLLATGLALADPVDIQVHVAASGSGGGPSGLYRVDLATGAIRLLAPRVWSSGDQVLGYGYGAVIRDGRSGKLTAVTKAGQRFELPGEPADAAAVDADGIHVWTANVQIDGVVLRRHRVDGGGVEREYALPNGVRLLTVGADGSPLVAGPTGGTFAVDPADGSLRRASDGLVTGVANAGLVELVCNDELACVQRWHESTVAEMPVLSTDSSGIPSVSPDGTRAVVVTRRGADTTDLATGATSSVRLFVRAPDALDEPLLAQTAPAWSADSESAAFAFGGVLYLYLHRSGEIHVGPTDLHETLGTVLAVAAARA